MKGVTHDPQKIRAQIFGHEIIGLGAIEIDHSERAAALLHLPLKTHIDMVTLTLDNLEMKLSAMHEANDERSETSDETNETKHSALNAQEFDLLMRLSARLMQQKERIDQEIEGQVMRGEQMKRSVQ